MMKITSKRKYKFAEKILSNAGDKIGFIDVGSGGPLKHPWNVIPENCLIKHSIEPTGSSEELPLCISNRTGKEKFYVAKDERASSLHLPSNDFVRRYNKESLLTKNTIEVQLSTLDEQFADQYTQIDLVDINTEGHDYQVLEGSQKLLDNGFVKLLKVEFELTEVWQNQGWFSDIDHFLRGREYTLAKIELDYQKPFNVKDIVHSEEPLWGKAYYVPAPSRWIKYFESTKDDKSIMTDIRKSVVLYTITEISGRAVDLLEMACSNGLLEESFVVQTKRDIKNTLKFLILGEVRRDLVRCLKTPLRVIKYLMT